MYIIYNFVYLIYYIDEEAWIYEDLEKTHFFFRTRFYLSTKRNNQYDPCLPYTVDDTVLLQVVG